MKLYTTTDIDLIVLEHGWTPTLCTNEKDGEYCEGINTIQLSKNGQEDYFGEFVQLEKNNGLFIFKFYTE